MLSHVFFVKCCIPTGRGVVYQLTYFQQEGLGFKKVLATCSKYWLTPSSLPEHEVAKVSMPNGHGMMVAAAHLAFNYPVPEHSLIELILLCPILGCQPQIYLPGVPSEGILQVSCKVHSKPSLHDKSNLLSSYACACCMLHEN